MTAHEMIVKLMYLRIKQTEIAKVSGVATRTVAFILEGKETSKQTDKKIAAAYEIFKTEILEKAGKL